MSYCVTKKDTGTLFADLPSDLEQRKKLAESLRQQIEQDTNEKDKEIHQLVLNELEKTE